MPTTPGCHPSECSTRPFAPYAMRASACSRADSSICFSISLALGVRGIERAGERQGALVRSGGEALEAQACVVEAAGGVDAGPEPEADVSRGDVLSAQAGDVLQGADAGPLGLRELFEPLAHEHAVGADERHDVGDGREGDEVHVLAQVGLGPRGKEPVLAQRAAQADGEVEGDAGGAQPLGGVAAAGLQRVQHREGLGHRLGHGVVIDDDAGRGPAGWRGRFVSMRGDAAVERDEQARAIAADALDGLGVEAVALAEPVGNVRGDVAADGAQEGQSSAVELTPSTS